MRITDFEKLFFDDYFVNREISQEKWISNSNFSEIQKGRFLKQFKSSRILYSIPVADTELQIIEVMLTYPSSSWQQDDFSRLIHKSIPYPVLLIQNYMDEQIKISTVISHINSNDNRRDVVDKSISTPWMKTNRIANAFSRINDCIFDIHDSRLSFEYKLFQVVDALGKQESECQSVFPSSRKTHKDTLEELYDDYRALCENDANPFERLVKIQEQLICLLDFIPESEDVSAKIENLDWILHDFSLDDGIDEISMICEELKEILVDYQIADRTMECFDDILISMREKWYNAEFASDD